MDPTTNEKDQPASPGLAHDSTANVESLGHLPRQTTVFDIEGIGPPPSDPLAAGNEVERAYARLGADTLGKYLADHPTGTLERALDHAGIAPPAGVRLWVVHPLAARWALRDGLAELSGGATRATAPQANAGLVRVYRRPSCFRLVREVTP